MRNFFIRHSSKIVALILFLSVCYGLGRLYFETTAGFSEANIMSSLPPSKVRETKPLTFEGEKLLKEAADQPYHYLAKGCQSYVFISEDKKYVLKFFKYQRFKIPDWLQFFSFLPPVEKLIQQKKEKKDKKLAFFMQAWKVAYDELQEESGLIYVHLNKSDNLKFDLVFYDKMGFKHTVAADQVEFLIQRKADTLQAYINREPSSKSKEVITRLVNMEFSEYQRGLADYDHALMQNTGVYNDHPFHIDIGQIAKDDKVKDPRVHNQEIFNKFYEFKLWLSKNHPELGEHLTHLLQEKIGTDYSNMKPFFGRIHD